MILLDLANSLRFCLFLPRLPHLLSVLTGNVGFNRLRLRPPTALQTAISSSSLKVIWLSGQVKMADLDAVKAILQRHVICTTMRNIVPVVGFDRQPAQVQLFLDFTQMGRTRFWHFHNFIFLDFDSQPDWQVVRLTQF